MIICAHCKQATTKIVEGFCPKCAYAFYTEEQQCKECGKLRARLTVAVEALKTIADAKLGAAVRAMDGVSLQRFNGKWAVNEPFVASALYSGDTPEAALKAASLMSDDEAPWGGDGCK